MLSFDPYDFQIRDRHQYIIGAVAPRPIAWASTISKNGAVNLAPYSFFNAFSSNPPLLIFSSNRRGRDNTTKHTLQNIEETGEVVINVVNYDLVSQMHISSIEFDENVNEFRKAGVTELKSDIVKPPRVQESPIHFECKVDEIIHTSQEPGAANLFLCKIVRIHIREDILDAENKIDPNKLNLVGRLGANYYTKVSKDSIFEIDHSSTTTNLGFDQLPNHIVNSQVLTGNEIATFAKQSTYPTEDEMNSISNSFLQMSEIEKHYTAKTWIAQGNIREAFALLLKK